MDDAEHCGKMPWLLAKARGESARRGVAAVAVGLRACRGALFRGVLSRSAEPPGPCRVSKAAFTARNSSVLPLALSGWDSSARLRKAARSSSGLAVGATCSTAAAYRAAAVTEAARLAAVTELFAARRRLAVDAEDADEEEKKPEEAWPAVAADAPGPAANADAAEKKPWPKCSGAAVEGPS